MIDLLLVAAALAILLVLRRLGRSRRRARRSAGQVDVLPRSTPDATPRAGRDAPPRDHDEDRHWAPRPARPRLAAPAPHAPPGPPETPPDDPFEPFQPFRTLTGRAYVVDGDGLVIQKTQIRLFGIDAPELDHPYGKTAKSMLITLCKGCTIRAQITGHDDHGRTVALCSLPDGRDLSAEMVKAGLAIDWKKFSGGRYRAMEVPGVRNKLWLADARQKGRMHVWEQFAARRQSGPR